MIISGIKIIQLSLTISSENLKVHRSVLKMSHYDGTIFLSMVCLPMYSIRHLRFRNQVKLNVYQLDIKHVATWKSLLLIILSLFYSQRKLTFRKTKEFMKTKQILVDKSENQAPDFINFKFIDVHSIA